MPNKNSEHSQAATEKLRIEQLREETRELSDEQSKAIAGGRSQLELNDAQLEALSFSNTSDSFLELLRGDRQKGYLPTRVKV